MKDTSCSFARPKEECGVQHTFKILWDARDRGSIDGKDRMHITSDVILIFIAHRSAAKWTSRNMPQSLNTEFYTH